MENNIGPGFNPEEIIFCPTSACNLKCEHCFVNQKAGNLNIEDSIRFLKSCAASGKIYKVGFSGGEPFLNLDFVCKLIEESVKNEMVFDRLMTNGAWWKTEEELFAKLKQIKNAGFDGKIGLSWDSFHKTPVQKVAMFITACHQVFDDETCVEILSVIRSGDEKNDDIDFTNNLIELGLTIGGFVTGKTNKKTKNGKLAIINAYSDIEVPVYRFSQSFLPDEKIKWHDKKWFTEDYCQSTGNVFYVHADGRIAPCCGFANEEESLIIGTIKDDFETLMKKASENPMVRICYYSGLENFRKSLKRTPGKTNDMCQFCAWVCRNKKDN